MNLGMGLYLSQRSGSFSPASLAGIAHWYRADQGITIATGVSQWNDLIGTAHLIQSTGANQPAYNATDAGYNGQATVQSTAATMYLAAAGAVAAQVFTVWFVGQSGSSGQVIFALAAGAPYLVNSSGKMAMYAGAVLGSNVLANAKHATLAIFNGTTSFIGVDNWLSGGVAGPAGAANGSAIGAFAQSNGVAGSIGKIAEVVIQAGTPTPDERAAMAAYFFDRYGIVVT